MSCRRSYIFKIFGIAIFATFWVSPAEAHLVTTGLGPVYDGIGHFMLSPDDIIPAITLALLAGLLGAEAGRRALFGLPLAWLSGGVIAMLLPEAWAWPEQLIAAISFLILGVLVASDLAMPSGLVLAMAGLLGLAHGFGNGTAMRDAGTGGGTLQLIGVTFTLFVLIALFAASVVSLRQMWTRIVVRVAGSWVAAMGLLLLGWYFKKKGV